MDDLDLGGSIHAGPDQCDQRIPAPDIGGRLIPSPGSVWAAGTQPRIGVGGAYPGPVSSCTVPLARTKVRCMSPDAANPCKFTRRPLIK